MKSLFIVAVLLVIFNWAGVFDRPSAERQEMAKADSSINALTLEHREMMGRANAVLDTFQAVVRNDKRDAEFVCIKAHSIDNLQVDRMIELQVVRQEAKINLSTQ